MAMANNKINLKDGHTLSAPNMTNNSTRCSINSFKNLIQLTMSNLEDRNAFEATPSPNEQLINLELIQLFQKYKKGEFDCTTLDMNNKITNNKQQECGSDMPCSLEEETDKTFQHILDSFPKLNTTLQSPPLDNVHMHTLSEETASESNRIDSESSSFKTASKIASSKKRNFKKKKLHFVDYKFVSTLTQSTSLIYQAKNDFECAKFLSTKKQFNCHTAFFLQQSAEKAMKGLIIANNYRKYGFNTTRTHHLLTLASEVGNEFKSICFRVANELNSLGDRSFYPDCLLALRARYQKILSMSNYDTDKLDSQTIPQIAFSEAHFESSIDLLNLLLSKCYNFLKHMYKGLPFPLIIQNYMIKFNTYNELILEKNQNQNPHCYFV